MNAVCEAPPELTTTTELKPFTRPLLVVGLGNDFRGDDAAGRLVARRVLGLLGPLAHGTDQLIVMENDGDAAELLACWPGFTTVVLVDAVVSGAKPGSVLHYDARTLPLDGTVRFASTHALGATGAVGLARAIGAMPKRLEVIGIEGSKFGMGDDISPEVSAGVEAAAAEIVRRIVDKA